jgi:hypothetical protein
VRRVILGGEEWMEKMKVRQCGWWFHIHIWNRMMKPLANVWSRVRRDVGGMQTMYHVRLFGIVIMNPLCTMSIC